MLLHFVARDAPTDYECQGKVARHGIRPLAGEGGVHGATATLQVSTNMTDWATCAVVTNQGAPVEWRHTGTARSQQFFRAVPQ